MEMLQLKRMRRRLGQLWVIRVVFFASTPRLVILRNSPWKQTLQSSASTVGGVSPGSCRAGGIPTTDESGQKPKNPRDQRVRFRVALAGTLRLDVLSIVIAERNRR
jgi:hypothetical protein